MTNSLHACAVADPSWTLKMVEKCSIHRFFLQANMTQLVTQQTHQKHVYSDYLPVLSHTQC